MNTLLQIVINRNEASKIHSPTNPLGRVRDIHKFNQRRIMIIIKRDNLRNTAMKFKSPLAVAYSSEN